MQQKNGFSASLLLSEILKGGFNKTHLDPPLDR